MHEVALAVQPVAAGDDLDAVVPAFVDEAQHPVELFGTDQRAAHHAFFLRTAVLHEVGDVRDALDHLVIDTALHENP